jgi:hypothetical protein|tara:strand:+ start:1800 stop:3074 length:1275 start_codon:yes stop_codon:yes gene_type:complete
MANKYGFSSVNRQVNFQDSKGLQVSSQIEEINKKFIYARVVDIILNERHPKFEELGGWSSIGTIFYLDVEVSTNSLNNSLIAKPLLSNSKNYPLVNEFVLLFLLPDNQVSLGSNIKKYFYLNPISIWNNPHLNAYPNEELSSTVQPSQQKSYQAIEQGQTRKSSSETINYSYNSPLAGGTFVERSNIHPLLAFAGDIITEGRWGNSIRFGSTAKSDSILYGNNWSNTGENGNPITIIRNGQPEDTSEEGYLPIVEDINKDLSSIYLTSNQEIPLKTTITNNPSIRDNSLESLGSYQGSQVMLNSSRLVFNANSTGSMLLNSEGAISLTSVYTVGIYSQEGDISLQSGRGTIRLGDYNANQSIILGDNFMFDFQDLLKKLRNLCQLLVGEPELVLSTGAAGSVKTTINLMLDNIDSYTSKIVKSI